MSVDGDCDTDDVQLLLGSGGDGRSCPLSDADLDRLYAWPDGSWVRANMVATVDGAATGDDGLSGSVNTPADQRVYARLRRSADCVLVGAGTARAEAYRPAELPLVVVSRHGHLPRGLAEGGVSGGRVVLVAPACAGRAPADDLWVVGEEEVDLAEVVARCAREGMPHVLAEGGPSLLGALLSAGLVDELAVTTSPLAIVGDAGRITSGPPARADLELGHVVESDGTLLSLWRIGRRGAPGALAP